jgi:hypothetical protein
VKLSVETPIQPKKKKERPREFLKKIFEFSQSSETVSIIA